MSSVAILGGAAFWDADEQITAQAVGRALDAGVNHIDVAPQYGRAEELLGPLVGRHRDELFVACKTLRHNAAGVRAQLETSLDRLRCEAVDLYQLHAVTDLAELDRRTDAVEALFEAREAGLCRYIGITGHELSTPVAQLEALRRYDLDTVMLPINPRLFAEPGYAEDVGALLAEASTRDVGVMSIKAAAARPWGAEGPSASTWYEPYRSVDELSRGVRFALSTPGVAAFCTPGDVTVLDIALSVAGSLDEMGDEERTAAIAEVADEALIFPMPHA